MHYANLVLVKIEVLTYDFVDSEFVWPNKQARG